ncbi:glycoside hydrolase family 26 protein [Zobellia roscoffensis]|uniref:glycoside hydrolase family 26 protein n=1 Tax=Zobellia roscoffensis TaxID=2779508 RepID=UPI00188D5E8E|nr:glycosyl hydrolase [Zobellia roscoffensis]
MNKGLVVVVFSVFLCFSCTSDDNLFDPNAIRIPAEVVGEVSFTDPNLVQEAKDLHTRLRSITQQGIAFGQQEAIGGSIETFDPNSLESDFSIVANDHPAIVGFDLEGLELNDPLNPDSSIRDYRKEWIVNAHENGSIITVSWHASNPITGKNSFDRVSAVSQMLENGTHRKVFLQHMERLALFFNDLKDSNGNPIPILFRPWHEMNGNFFFWGEGLRTTEEFKQLFRDTVTILTEDFNVHNLLYLYAPNSFSHREEYLQNYPGDVYVDLLGIDIYDFSNGDFLQKALHNLKIVERIAMEKNMLFALTETGLENLPQHDWYTENLYKAIRSSGIIYTLVWRNAVKTHFYVPYVGHSSENSFKEFVDKDVILLNKDIK